MSHTKGDDPTVHFIRDGRFVCTAEAEAECRNYPGCACEEWGAELHDPPAPGHEDVPQEECWAAPWIDAADLCESYGPEEGRLRDDDEFPDGPVSITWEGDYLTWEYADETRPREEEGMWAQ